MSTPDEEVAAGIIEKFREAGLLSEIGLKKLYPNLVAGKLKAEDWRFIFETYRPNAEGGHAPQS
jgi:hypothetical protein